MILLLPLPLILASSYPRLCLSAAVNRTIDDKNGDSVTGAVPSYIPESPQWIQGDQCSFCNINSAIIDVDQVHNGTWHDATYLTKNSSSELVIAFNFEGSAIYIYNIIVNQVPSSTGPVTTATNLSFHIDGVNVGQFTRAPDDSKNVLYNVPVYVNTSLENKQHTMQIRASGKSSSLILFDYAQYTVEEDESDPSTPSTTPSTTPSSVSSQASTNNVAQSQSTTNSRSHVIGAALGGAAAGIVAVASATALAFCIIRGRRRRRHAQHREHHTIDSTSSLETRERHQPWGAALRTREPPAIEPNYASRTPVPYNSLSPDGTSAFGTTAPASEASTYDRDALVARIRTLEARMRALRADHRAMNSDEKRDIADCPPTAEVRRGDQMDRLYGEELSDAGERMWTGSDTGGTTVDSGVGTVMALSEMRSLMREMEGLRAELAMRERRLAGGALPTYVEALSETVVVD